MEVFLSSVEADLRNLSTEARKSETLAGQLAGWLVNSEHPEVKVAAERAILKLRALGRQTLTKETLKNSKELLRPFLLACETKNARLTVLALGCVQKLLANDTVSEEGTMTVITTLQHVERCGDEAVKLKMMQIVLTLVQDTSFKSTDHMASVLGVCFRILSHSRNTDTVLNTAAATIRQVVAVMFEHVTTDEALKKESTNAAALLLIEDLCHLAGGAPAIWLQSPSVSQHFALELIEFIIADKPELFHTLSEFENALRERICHVLQHLLTEAFELDAEPSKSGAYKYTFKVLSTLLRRFYTLIPGKLAQIWHPLCAGAASYGQRWRQVLCLQVLKICVSDPGELYYLYVMYDMARDFDILAVSRVVDVTVELLNPRKRSLGGDESNKSLTLLEEKVSTPASSAGDDGTDELAAGSVALEVLLKMTNAIHMLSENCVESSECNQGDETVYLTHVCRSMLDRFSGSFYNVFRGYLSSGNCSESAVLMILKGYQDTLRSAAAFELTSITEKFLTSLCCFSVPSSNDSGTSFENPVLSSLNVHAVRTLLNVVHQLGNVLGPSWTAVVNTLYALDGILMSSLKNREIRSADLATEADLDILETSMKNLFAGTADLCTEAVVFLLASLRDVSLESLTGTPGKHTRPSFCLERMVDILLTNLDRVHDLWGEFLAHVIEVLSTTESASWTVAIDALDRALIGILDESLKGGGSGDEGAVENMLLVALESLFSNASHRPIRVGILRISLHVLQRSGESLTRGWEPMVRLLQSVPEVADAEVVSIAFDSVELLVNEYLDQLQPDVQARCLRMVSSFAKQSTVMNVSLTSINLLWSAVDMFGREAKPSQLQSQGSFPGNAIRLSAPAEEPSKPDASNKLFYLITVLQELSLDKRPEVRNSGIRSFFAAMVSYGSKFYLEEWNRCLSDVLLPLLKSVYYISMTSSSDETEAVELGKEKGRSVMMLMHYSRNTERKQWEETMVLALNGLCKILRLYLPLLLGLHAFSQAWDQIVVICKNSMVQGSKDAALAAIALIIQVSETFGSSTTQLPTQTMTSILRSMEESMELITHPESLTPAIVRVELVKAIGLIAKSTKKILPESAMPMFIQWLQRLACKPFNAEEAEQNMSDMLPITQKEMLSVISAMPESEKDELWHKVIEALCSFLYPMGIGFEASLCIPASLATDFYTDEESSTLLWLSHIVEQLEKMYLNGISKELQEQLFSQVLASLTRCMASRFVHHPEGPSLWIKAASLFRSVLDVGLSSMPEDARNGHRWMRNWETIASSFEAVFIGRHIKATSSSERDPFSSAAASELKLSLLDTLAEVVISSCNRMSESTLRRLVSLIDATISLHSDSDEGNSPSGNLCHSCLRKLFVLCSQTNDTSVAVIALPLFIARCRTILSVYSGNSSDTGTTHLSLVRVGEVVFVLEMLSSLRVSPAVAEAVLVDYPIHQRVGLSRTHSGGSIRRPTSSWLTAARRPHLFMIYDTLCDCVMSKEAHVRAIVLDLLKSVGHDIGLL